MGLRSGGFGVGVLLRQRGQAGRWCKVGIGRGQAVLCGVQSGDLLLLACAESYCFLDDQEGDGNGDRCPQDDGEHAQHLQGQEADTAAVEQPHICIVSRGRRGGKEAHRDGAPNAVQAVDRHGAHRVVNAQLVIQSPDAKDHQDAGHRADDNGAQRIRHVTRSGDGYQPGQGGVQAHRDVRLPILDPGEDHAGDGRHRRGNRGSDEDGAQLLQRGGRSAIEAVPPQP